MDRIILHVDINSCYASIECLYHPELRDRPMAVGGDVQTRHGIILAKNEPAKRYGVKTGEAIWQAKQKCPELIALPPRFELYLRFSRMARSILRQYSDRLEPFGIDEAWLDISGCSVKSGRETADEIRRRFLSELGITVSVGVSFNKIFAKLGSDYKKPNAVTVFTRENFREKIWPLPVSSLLYVGPSTARKLASLGMSTIGHVAVAQVELLEKKLGKWGAVIHAFANGYDSEPVALYGSSTVIKSIGNSTTTPRDLTCDTDADIVFHTLCESVASRLREQGLIACGVQISLRNTSLQTIERQARLISPSAISTDLHHAAMTLLRGNHRWPNPLRSIGIRAIDLIPASTPLQMTIFESPERRLRKERLELAVDEIRRRFGRHSINRAITTSDPSLSNITPKDDRIMHHTDLFEAM